ncbi:MAG: M50 family metallopeptidase [Anaerolineales bacterium]|nr:M50 family metallopeptidase [Anaerolineales bacterium]
MSNNSYVGRSEKEEAEAKKQVRQERREGCIVWMVIIAVVLTAAVIIFGLSAAIKAIGFLFRLLAAAFGGALGIAIYLWVIIVIPLIVTVFAHEMGHVIAGALVGFIPRKFQVWRFALFYNRGKWRIQSVRLNDLQSGGGVMFTTSNYRNLSQRMLFLTVGGPAVSSVVLIAAVIFAVAARLWESIFLLAPVLVFILVALLNLLGLIVPDRYRAENSDGQTIKELRKGGPKAERQVVYHIIFADNASGIHPREWNYDLLIQAAPDRCRRPWHCILLFFAAAAAVSHQDIERATTFMNSIQEYMNPDDPKFRRFEIGDLLKNAIYLDIAFFEAFYRDDPVKARVWFERVSELEELERGRAGTEAAILMAEGHYQEVIEKAEKGKFEQGKRKPITGSSVWRNEELDTLIAKAEAFAGNA